MVNKKISIDIKSFAELIEGNFTFVQRFFGDAETVTRQMRGIFEGEIKTFNIYRTQRIGQGGFCHWPVPYSHTEVVALLLQNSHSVKVRELLAPEIMSVCKTGRLPQTMWEQFSEFRWAHEQTIGEDSCKEALFNEISHNLKFADTNYSAENFEELVRYLKDMPKLTPIEFKQLIRLADCQLKEEINFIWFKHFCTKELIFRMFVQTYLAALKPEDFSAGTTPFILSTTLDALLEVTSPPIRLCIWECQPPSTHYIYLGGRPDVPITHVLRNCEDTIYFELMADTQHPLGLTQLPTQSNCNSLKRGPIQYDPTNKDCYRKQIEVDGKNCTVDVMDAAGQDDFTALKDQFMKTGQIMVVAFSVLSKESFAQVPKWLRSIKRVHNRSFNSEFPYVVLVGNKIDEDEERVIDTTEGQDLADKYEVPYVEVSTRLGTNIVYLFESIVRMYRWNKLTTAVENLDQQTQKPSGLARIFSHRKSKSEKKSELLNIHSEELDTKLFLSLISTKT